MSWDVIIMHVPDGVLRMEEMPDQPTSPLGSSSEVISKLKSVFPSVDFSDPAWGILDGKDFSIEFNIGKEEQIGSMMLHVRGSEASLAAIQQICQALDCRAIDMSEGDFIDFNADPGAGLRNWQTFRDQVVEAVTKQGGNIIRDPKLPGIRPDAITTESLRPPKKWWQFWK